MVSNYQNQNKSKQRVKSNKTIRFRVIKLKKLGLNHRASSNEDMKRLIKM